MSKEQMDKEIREHMECKNQIAQDIVDLLRKKEPGITFEKAEKILLDTVDVLQKVSKRQKL